MNEKNDKQKQEAGACGPGCACGTAETGGRGRIIAGVVILAVAGVLVARAVMKNNDAQAANTATAGFATLPAPAETPAPDAATQPPATDTLKEIAGLSDLNTVAADTSGVFVFLPAKGEASAKAPLAQMRGAARTIEPQLRGGKVAMFTLKAGSQDYEQIARQMAVPGVLAMVKGAGMSATSGDVTETKLVQAFVAASRAEGCGPSAAGCGPSGCQ
jgi:MYXO-CTERM domain-containing protein